MNEPFTQIELRIVDDLRYFGNNMPERFSIAWHGYIAGLMEWGLLSISEYDKLFDMLPPLDTPNPVESIFTGREI